VACESQIKTCSYFSASSAISCASNSIPTK
jgi:hypothetical protein